MVLHIVLQGADIMLRLPYDAELVLIDADLLLQQLTLPLPKTKNKLTEMDVTIKYWRLSATVLKRTDAMLHFPIQYTVGRITAISRRRATLPWQQKDIADKNGISTSKKNRSIAAIPCPI